jgi:glutamate-1-semialdehyde 2,1-aminomutase
LLIQRREFIESVVNTARRHGALVIFDEVISGFRIALGGMAEILGMRPDLVTYGKVIGGGFPVAAYGGRKDLMELVAPVGPVYQAGTLSANPVGMRAGLATLQKVEKTQAYSVLGAKTAQFCDRLNNQFAAQCLPFTVTHTASIFWLHLSAHGPIRRIEQIPAPNADAFARLFHAALNGGVYLAPSGYEVNFMSLAHSDELLDEAAKVLIDAAQSASGN